MFRDDITLVNVIKMALQFQFKCRVHNLYGFFLGKTNKMLMHIYCNRLHKIIVFIFENGSKSMSFRSGRTNLYIIYLHCL